MACDVLPVGKFLTNFLAEMDHYDKKVNFLLFGGKKTCSRSTVRFLWVWAINSFTWPTWHFNQKAAWAKPCETCDIFLFPQSSPLSLITRLWVGQTANPLTWSSDISIRMGSLFPCQTSCLVGSRQIGLRPSVCFFIKFINGPWNQKPEPEKTHNMLYF